MDHFQERSEGSKMIRYATEDEVFFKHAFGISSSTH